MRVLFRTLFLLAALLGLTVPAAAQSQTTVVRAGDTLTRIARRHHVTVDTLRRANRIRGEIVRPGQRLTIPSRARSGTWRAQSGVRRHRVRAGDTLARIARRFRTSVGALRTANGLRSETIRPGETLLVPRPGQSGASVRAAARTGNPATVEAPPLPEDVQAEAGSRARELGLGPTHIGQRLLREGPDPRWVEAAGDADSTLGTLMLPVEGGRFLRGWGSGAGGYHLAVDIGATPGTDVHAAETGLVAYSGTGIRGYGNFIILVHPNGWVTAYAHQQVNLVTAGQRVERGDVIGKVGQTGFARGPHCHFILVSEGEHCDPVPLFSPRIEHANGVEVEGPDVVWETAHRPSAVQCLNRSERPNPNYAHNHRRRRRL